MAKLDSLPFLMTSSNGYVSDDTHWNIILYIPEEEDFVISTKKENKKENDMDVCVLCSLLT